MYFVGYTWKYDNWNGFMFNANQIHIYVTQKSKEIVIQKLENDRKESFFF